MKQALWDLRSQSILAWFTAFSWFYPFPNLYMASTDLPRFLQMQVKNKGNKGELPTSGILLQLVVEPSRISLVIRSNAIDILKHDVHDIA